MAGHVHGMTMARSRNANLVAALRQALAHCTRPIIPPKRAEDGQLVHQLRNARAKEWKGPKKIRCRAERDNARNSKVKRSWSASSLSSCTAETCNYAATLVKHVVAALYVGCSDLPSQLRRCQIHVAWCRWAYGKAAGDYAQKHYSLKKFIRMQCRTTSC
jgi:hypothetical protein